MAYFAEHIWPKQANQAHRRTRPRVMGGTWEAVWPANVWAGTSVESQRYVPRLACLLRVPAAVRFISAEPLLEDIKLRDYLYKCSGCGEKPCTCKGLAIQWVIAGCESGPRARTMDINWVRSLRDQCEQSGAAFFFKQAIINGKEVSTPVLDGYRWAEFPHAL